MGNTQGSKKHHKKKIEGQFSTGNKTIKYQR